MKIDFNPNNMKWIVKGLNGKWDTRQEAVEAMEQAKANGRKSGRAKERLLEIADSTDYHDTKIMCSFTLTSAERHRLAQIASDKGMSMSSAVGWLIMNQEV